MFKGLRQKMRYFQSKIVGKLHFELENGGTTHVLKTMPACTLRPVVSMINVLKIQVWLKYDLARRTNDLTCSKVRFRLSANTALPDNTISKIEVSDFF